MCQQWRKESFEIHKKNQEAKTNLGRVRRLETGFTVSVTGVKSPSPRHLFLIALHSPGGVAETGLLICPLEKKARNLACGVKSVTFSGPLRTSGPTGALIGILGQGFTGTKKVMFAGGPASFTVISDTYLTATVPSAARTGFVSVKTPGGTLKSSKQFLVTQ